ncbi:hypothetical protein B1H18_02830 [Streptomyces tsukubensis]|uniref:4-hydroxybenzoate polyprenyltransferase n=1 Tax=Streptomyces tsukubensis TaxID=83656 RepID=A0A1V4AH97_9ACTN|nr:hypothetical protein B1H18_02830 [Streptomyces tsukubensis]
MYGLLIAAHLAPTLAVSLLVTLLAVVAGQSAARCLLVAAAVLAGQLSVGWSNDAIDAVRDAETGRREKPVAAGVVGVATVRAAACAALLLCAVFSLACGPLAGAVHLLGVIAAWTYNLGLKATVLSWLPYAVGFGALPAFVSLGLPGRPAPAWWVVVAAALIGVGAHLANVLPDIAADLITGVRGWPQRLGPARVRILLPAPLVAATVLLAVAGPGPVRASEVVTPSAVTVAAVGGALLGRRFPRLPFLTAILIAAIDVVLLFLRRSALG